VKDFWRDLNIKKTIDSTEDACVKVSQSCRNGVWRNIWPDAVIDFHGFDPEEEISNSRHGITDMTTTVGAEDSYEANVEELFQSHTEELSNENLLSWKKN
jgi:hypothetical protein